MLGLTFGKHLHDRITPVRGGVSSHTTSLRPPFLMKLPVPRQDSERSCICVRSIDFASFYDFDIWILELFRQTELFVFHFIVCSESVSILFIGVAMKFIQTLIEINSPTGKSYISFILEYFDQQFKENNKTMTVPFGSLVWCWLVWAVFSFGLIFS